MSKSYDEGYNKGFNDTIEIFKEAVGIKDRAFGDGKMTRRHLPKVKKEPIGKRKKSYKPKWG